ncbi:hypothetical protein JCM19000A_31180 [Silvimonas sp. JCM 19000]
MEYRFFAAVERFSIANNIENYKKNNERFGRYEGNEPLLAVARSIEDSGSASLYAWDLKYHYEGIWLIVNDSTGDIAKKTGAQRYIGRFCINYRDGFCEINPVSKKIDFIGYPPEEVIYLFENFYLLKINNPSDD